MAIHARAISRAASAPTSRRRRNPSFSVARRSAGTTAVSERDPRELGSDFIAHVTKAEASDGEVAVFTAGYEAAVRAQKAAEAQEVA